MNKNLSLDTCAFFMMLKYASQYSKNGTLALDNKINEIEEKYKNNFNELNETMDYLLSFENTNTNNISFENKIKLLTEKFENSKKAEGETIFNDLLSKYKNSINDFYIGKLFKARIQNKVNFFVTPTAFDEINYHRASAVETRALLDKSSKKSDKGIHKFPDKSIDGLMNYCVILIYANDEQKRKVAKLSDIVRGIQSDVNGNVYKFYPAFKPNDTNRQNIHSDSTIMCEAESFNTNLVTTNLKDFIFYEKDENFSKFNDDGTINPARRNLVKEIFEKLGLNSDCLAYSPEEFFKMIEKNELEKNKTQIVESNASKNSEKKKQKDANFEEIERSL